MKRKPWSPESTTIDLGWVVPACVCDRAEGILKRRGFCISDEMHRDELVAFCNGHIFVAIYATDYDMDGRIRAKIIIEDKKPDPELVTMLASLA